MQSQITLSADVQWSFGGKPGPVAPTIRGAHNEMSASEFAEFQRIRGAAVPTVPATTTGSDRHEIMARLEQIGQEILGTSQPLYCLFRSELPAEVVIADPAMAITGRSLDAALRSHIPWYSGRGRCIVFNAMTIMAEFGRRAPTEGIGAAFTHEIAHIAVGGFATNEDDARDPVAAESCRTFSELQCSMQPIAAAFDHFDAHDDQFFRALVHVLARAHQAGLKLDIGYEFERCGLSDVNDYAETLAGELASFAGEPLFAALRETNPPAEFLELFATDVARVRSMC